MIKVLLITAELFMYWWNLILASRKIFDSGINKYFFLPVLIIIYGPLMFIGVYFDYSIFVYSNMLAHVLQIIGIKILTKDTRTSAIVGTYILIYCVNVIAIMTANCLFKPSEYGLLAIDFVVNLIVFLGSICCYASKNISRKIKQIILVLPSKIKILTIASYVISAWVMSLMASNPYLSENEPWSIAMRISLVLLALFVCITFPILLINVLTNLYLKKQNEGFERELAVQADYYTALSKSNHELRRFRHDFNNIRIGIAKLISKNDCEAALEMIEGAHEHLHDLHEGVKQYDTGNGLVDAILQDKQKRAGKDGVVITFIGSVPPRGLSAMDLCVIFGNTLDNAVEACQKLPKEQEKVISVSSQCKSGFLFISIKNPVIENVTIQNNMIETSKKDRALHGYGLYSLRKTVKKYEGELRLVSENRMFQVDIDLSIKIA